MSRPQLVQADSNVVFKQNSLMKNKKARILCIEVIFQIRYKDSCSNMFSCAVGLQPAELIGNWRVCLDVRRQTFFNH